nr:MAG TPA: Z DNA-binding protein [Bacteriophage sp.]
MEKGFILRIDFVEKFGFSGTTLVLVSLLVDALQKGDGWLTMQQDEIAKMLGISSARVNQIFRILKRGGFLLQKKATGRKYRNRKEYKFNEEKLK